MGGTVVGDVVGGEGAVEVVVGEGATVLGVVWTDVLVPLRGRVEEGGGEPQPPTARAETITAPATSVSRTPPGRRRGRGPGRGPPTGAGRFRVSGMLRP